MIETPCSLSSLAAFLPGVLSWLSGDARHALDYSFFQVGSLAVTPLFLMKAALFLVVLTVVSRLFERVVLKRVFSRLSMSDSLKFALSRFITYAILLGGLFIGVQSLGVNLNSLVVFGGALGVGVGLGLQNVVSNFVAGLILLIEQPIRMGDRIEVKDTFGDVVRIGARSTWVRTNDNFVIILPNSEFINNSVINWTANDPRIRLNVPVGVSYNADPERVRDLLLDVARANPTVLTDPAPDVIFNNFGDSSLDFTLRIWTESQVHQPANLNSDLYFAIFRSFKDNKIEIPFPQRDLHIRSSDIALPYRPDKPPGEPGAPNPTAAA
jgi:small-conductance mechanosensitive channel